MALSGYLLRNGVSPEEVLKILRAAWSARWAPQEAFEDLERIVRDTDDKLKADQPVTGGRTLDTLIPGMPRKIAEFLAWESFTTRDGRRNYPLSDLGNGERLADRYRGNVRYCHPLRRWFVWEGTRWRPDDTGEVVRRAKATVRGIYEEATTAEDDAKAKEVSKWAGKSQAKERIGAMISLAESEPGIPVTTDQLDRDRGLLNVRNGTIDLSTGRLKPHDPRDLITKLAGTSYDPNAVCPTWDAFLRRVLPSEALRRFVQRLVGYALTGDVSEQILPFLYGSGANGKSVFINAIMEALGDYAQQAAPELLTAKGHSHPTELADLKGARFVASIEVEDGKRLAESLVKQLTGGDRIKARRMREDFWEFDPTHKVFLVANHRPVVAGTDYAIWRRIKMIPFGVTIPEDERDPHLLEKLRSELSGILAWAVRGCLDWQREGLGEPKEVKAATDEYKVEQDVLATFIEEACVVDPEASDTAGNLYSAYVEWCEETGESPETQRKFGTRLREKGFERREGTTGGRKGRYVYHGIAVFRPGGLPGGPPKGGGGGPSSQKVHPTNSLQNAGQSFKSGEAVDLSGPKSGMTGLEVTSSRGDSEKRSTMVHSSTDGPPVPPPTHSAWGTDPEDEEPTDNPVSPSAYDIKPALERVYERLGYAPVKPAAVAKEAGLPEDEVRGLLARGEANDTFTEITPGAYVPRHQFEAGVKLALARIGRPATASEIADVAKATPEKVLAYLETGPRPIIKIPDGLYAMTSWPGVGRVDQEEAPAR
ncbi:MAG: phage/plasmid primase, P4 family, partial [Actinomycetota bacterium]|nr:phage/plasmid primase, P4 family [Actinomycetota bacterium]